MWNERLDSGSNQAIDPFPLIKMVAAPFVLTKGVGAFPGAIIIIMRKVKID